MIQLAINMDESRFSRHLATGVPTELRAGREPVRNPKNTIPAVNRTLDLVRILAEGEAETNTKALALRLGMPLTTCYRVLCSLIGRGWVQRVADGRHILSPGLNLMLPTLIRTEHENDLGQTGRLSGVARFQAGPSRPETLPVGQSSQHSI